MSKDIVVKPAKNNTLKSWAAELQKVQNLDPQITGAFVRGGAVLDALLGLAPNDIDILYDLEDKNQKCICEQLSKDIESNGIFSGYSVDVEASSEKEPNNGAIMRSCGYFSYHTEYNSMFVLGADGNVYGDARAWQALEDRVYNYRPQNLVMWRSFLMPKDIQNFYETLVADSVRFIRYCTHRDLTLGDEAIELCNNLAEVISKIDEPSSQLQEYVRTKLTREMLDTFNKDVYALDAGVVAWLRGLVDSTSLDS